jgi:hypothetical protein
MRWGWLLPDASYEVLYDGWERQSHEPRHGRPPLVIRGVYSAAMAMMRARARYLGAVDEEAMAGAGGQATIGGRAAAAARVGASGGRAAGVGASNVGTARVGTGASRTTAANRGTAAHRQRTAD